MTMPTHFQNRGLTGPIMMIAIGSMFLVGQFIPEFGFHRLWPVLLIVAGVVGLVGRR